MPYKDPAKVTARSKAKYAALKADPEAMACARAEKLAQQRAKATDPEYRARRNENARRQREKDPERVRRTHRESKMRTLYGVEPEQFETMLAAQGGVCAICAGPQLGKNRLAIDHDHVTGAVRGLLCDNCNQALGKFKDDPLLLERASAYLRKHGV